MKTTIADLKQLIIEGKSWQERNTIILRIPNLKRDGNVSNGSVPCQEFRLISLIGRQIDKERGSSADLALHLDVSAVLLDNLVDDY